MEENYKLEKIFKNLLKSVKGLLKKSDSKKLEEDSELSNQLLSILALTILSDSEKELEISLTTLKEVHKKMGNSSIWLSSIAQVLSFLELDDDDQIWEGNPHRPRSNNPKK
jgi:nitrogen regulatory protein PII